MTRDKLSPDYRFSAKYERHIRLMEKRLKEFKAKIIALDLGMTYGFSYLIGNKLVYGYNNVSPTRFASQLASIYSFMNHIDIIEKEMHGIDAIIFEEVHGTKGVYAMQVNGAFLGALVAAGKKYNVKIIKGYEVSSIKGYAVGKGNASKKDMIMSANERYGLYLDPDNDIHGNMADAIHLLSLSMEALFSMGSLSDYVKEKIRVGTNEKK